VYSPAYLGDRARVEDGIKRALAYPHPTRPEALERQGRGLLAWNGTRVAALKRLRQPTLVLVGRDDVLTPPTFSRDLAALIPGATLKVLPGGHGFFLEEAPAFNRALLGFLRRAGRR
jgi:pimeloyl-ACP methyl ester carboxylesterase